MSVLGLCSNKERTIEDVKYMKCLHNTQGSFIEIMKNNTQNCHAEGISC